MEYPYIGINHPKTQTVIIYSDGSAFHLGGEFKGEHSKTYNTEDVKNITRKYLEGRCVKIESPEHSEFVQKLAFNAGFEWKSTGEFEFLPVKSGYIHFRSEGMLRNYTTSFSELTTIPLPPKKDDFLGNPKSDFDNAIDKVKELEWPQVGDAVVVLDSKCIVTSTADSNGNLSVLTDKSFNAIVNMCEIKKPKTEAEILRDKIHKDVSELINMDSSTNAIVELVIDKYITKKPQ